MRERSRTWVVATALFAVVVLVLGSPILMAGVSGTLLPWGRLADIGDAYGGASALLSAAALCGVGASLLYQHRQMRQELTNLDRQHHMELLKLAIDHPEFIEVLDGATAEQPHARHELYANLTMMYWFAIWELGEIDDDEVSELAAKMFYSPIARRWWARSGDTWTGDGRRTRQHHFGKLVSAELHKVETTQSDPTEGRSKPQASRPALALAISLATVGATAGAAWQLRRRRFNRHL